MNGIRLITICLVIISAYSLTPRILESAEKPNIIVILADDLGYGDLACYGAKDIATPAIDRMAAEGVKCNSFYVSAVCSPTRASLMTGSHSIRVGIGGVMFPRNNHGLNPDEITLPELLKQQEEYKGGARERKKPQRQKLIYQKYTSIYQTRLLKITRRRWQFINVWLVWAGIFLGPRIEASLFFGIQVCHLLEDSSRF